MEKVPLVQQPDNTHLRATGSGALPLSDKLSQHAQEARVLPNLKSTSMIALGKLCDNNCKVVLSKNQLEVIKDKNIILEWHWNRTNDLWEILITKTTLAKNNFRYQQTIWGFIPI